MSVLQKLKKNSTVSEAQTLDKSTFFSDVDFVPTSVPALNIALSGKLDGGLSSGFTMFAGPSKHFKTAFTMVLAKAYLTKYPESILLFYDSEFGAPQSYFSSFGIPLDRVFHTPITDVEMLKHDIMNQFANITRQDRVMVIIDSIGNLASKKEIDDATEGKSVADMTRAKQLKSLFRMVVPHLTMKDIPLIAVNHTYETLELYKKTIVGGGTGSVYGANNIFIIGRQQEKDSDNEITGYNFIINVEKSRFVREKSKIPISVSYEGGISTWSGLLDIALESGHVIKPQNGWYSHVDMTTGEVLDKKYRKADTNNKEFWMPILNDPTFRKWIEDTYRLSMNAMLTDENINEEYNNA